MRGVVYGKRTEWGYIYLLVKLLMFLVVWSLIGVGIEVRFWFFLSCFRFIGLILFLVGLRIM